MDKLRTATHRARRQRAEIWAAVHEERHRLAGDLETIAPERWQVSSLCAGWSVHDVLAHLVDSAVTSRRSFARQMITARFDFDRVNDHGVHRHKAADPQVTLTRFRAVTASTSTPPGPLATRLVEAYVHGEDIRRPLGIQASYPHAHVLTALDYLARASAGFGGGRDRVRGLRLAPEETDRHIGDGALVRGPAMSLLLAVSGRPVGPEELSGPGAAALAARL